MSIATDKRKTAFWNDLIVCPIVPSTGSKNDSTTVREGIFDMQLQMTFQSAVFDLFSHDFSTFQLV